MNIQHEIEGLKIREKIRPEAPTVLSGTMLIFDLAGFAELSVWEILTPFAVFLLMLFVNTIFVTIKLILANMRGDQ